MAVINRKCNECGNLIDIDTDNIQGISYYNKFYYHNECLMNKAIRLALKSGKIGETWSHVLEHIEDYQADAKDQLELPMKRDELCEYLLSNYNVIHVPDRFWEVTGSLGKGIYKKKKCKPVTLKIILETWRWGQHKLNKIDRNNKMNHTGPKNDEERILYDLAIIIKKIPNYLAHKAKIEAQQAEVKRESEKTHINYDNMQVNKVQSNNYFDDISSLLDEM